jgi:MscS family membrane protein
MENFLEIFRLSPDQSWLAEIIGIIIIAAILAFISNHFLAAMSKLSKMTENFWDDVLINAANAPLKFLIWLFAAKFCSEILIQQYRNEETELALPITKIAIILCFSWFLIRLVNFAAQSYAAAEKYMNDEFRKTTIDAVAKVMKIIIVVFAILIILQILGFSISGILAAGGAGGLVIGFAAKDLFANIFGGVTIYLDRPFNVGDWIRCNVNGVEGVVEHIGWRQTRLRSLNKNPIYVPNAIFTNAVVENPSRMTHRRIKEYIGIRHQDLAKMEIITDEIREYLRAHAAIDKAQQLVVNFELFGESSLNFIITAFTTRTHWQEYYKLKQEILLQVAQIIEKNGAKISVPTTRVETLKE